MYPMELGSYGLLTGLSKQKGQHTLALQIAGSDWPQTLLRISQLRGNGLRSLASPQIILETVSMMSGGVLRTDKYHRRTVCQAVIFRLRIKLTTPQTNFTRFVRWRKQYDLSSQRISPD
jgi:hypothetical protein